MHITARSSMTTQHPHSFKFILVNKCHSQHSKAAICCVGHHFLILYTCAHVVSFQTTVIGLGVRVVHKQNCELTSSTHGIPALFAYFLACHPYILLHFLMFLFSCSIIMFPKSTFLRMYTLIYCHHVHYRTVYIDVCTNCG